MLIALLYPLPVRLNCDQERATNCFRWGRNQETVSEDPLLSGVYGAEFSLGMQYNRPLGASASADAPPPAEPSAVRPCAVLPRPLQLLLFACLCSYPVRLTCDWESASVTG